MSSEYGDQYYAWQREGASASAEAMLPTILDLISPTSILDVGCGTGAWLRVAIDHGIDDVMGVDGGTGELVVPAETFRRMDLERPLDLGRTFDLVICMEVAEHLSRGRAATVVSDLCRAGDVVLFSAAIPGQGFPASREHQNEQWQSHWAELFTNVGYRTVDAIRPLIWDDDRIAFWYRQNAFVAIGPSASIELDGATSICDVVHPDLWRHVNAELWSSSASPRLLLRRLPSALQRVLRQRLGVARSSSRRRRTRD